MHEINFNLSIYQFREVIIRVSTLLSNSSLLAGELLRIR